MGLTDQSLNGQFLHLIGRMTALKEEKQSP